MPANMPTKAPAPLKILVVADGHGGAIYADAIRKGFDNLGHTTQTFYWQDYFHNYPYAESYKTDIGTKWGRLKSIWFKAQNKFTFGPAVVKLNLDLVAQAKAFKPDLIFLYRGTHVWPCTLTTMKKATGAKIFGYNNDDPFSPTYPKYFWRHFRRGVPHYDHLFAYREKNLADYAEVGMVRTSLLRSYYLKDSNKPILPRPANKKFACDVIFIGHFEDDGRDQVIKHLMDNGVDVKLYGPLWYKSPFYAEFMEHMGGVNIQPLYGADYNVALNSAKIALVFLSKLNNDTYTRRCFEIPAVGTVMASEYTEDLAQNLFKPDEEAIYFQDKEELLVKVQSLLAAPKKLQAMALAGQKRLLASGHEATDRARQVVGEYYSGLNGRE